MRIQSNINLSQILWYKIGGVAKYVLEVSTPEDIFAAVLFLQEKNIKKFFIVGKGSNLLFSDNYFDGAVICLTSSSLLSVIVDDSTITAFAGHDLHTVIQTGFSHRLIGLEWAGGLPGTVGAAVRGNVGAFGGEIKDVIVEANVIDMNYYSSLALAKPRSSLQAQAVGQEKLQFGYRSSLIKQHKNLIVLSATFRLKQATTAELNQAKEIYEKNIAYRTERHPLDYPNCGSVFKNIKDPWEIKKILAVFPEIKPTVETTWHGKVSMGYLIKRIGLSGFRIGNAEVSQKHANFIVNLGNATFKDVSTIIVTIEEKIQEIFGFKPEVEVEIVY